MPNMFSRRQKSTANLQPIDRSTYAAATTAATSAFAQRSQSMNSLSSAAAAAALRSHTTSPEPVGSIQTKRMVRRGSNSSAGSGNGSQSGVVRGTLHRSNSNGSMTERTFRSPSPSRANGVASPASPSSGVPPVPALPSNVHKRASSLDPPPQRITSPTPEQGKRGSSADAAATAQSSGKAKHTKRLSNVVETEEVNKVNETPPKNFSRPMSPQPSSPVTSGTAQKYTHGTGSWYTQSSGSASTPPRPTTSDGTPSRSSTETESSLARAPSDPARKKRVSSGPGSHLAQANQNSERSYGIAPGTAFTSSERSYGIAPGTAYAAPVKVYDPNTRTFVEKPKERQKDTGSSSSASKPETVFDPNTRTFIPRSQASREGLVDETSEPAHVAATAAQPKKQRPTVPVVNTSPQPPPRNPARLSPRSQSPSSPPAAHGLHKQPSLVREDPEGEAQAEALDSPKQESKDGGRSVSSSMPSKTVTTPSQPHQRSASLDVPSLGMDAAGRGRTSSHSPQRSAHFSPSPVMMPERHVPPPRDISPAKSALKYSPASSVRTSSPVATFSLPGPAATQGPSSEASESPSFGSQDGSGAKKKKSVRVSFNEEPREIESPSITTSTPTQRSRTLSFDEEDDAVMKPRPALPSFGSVRRDRVQPELAEKVTEMPPERHGTSSDHAIGGILRNSLEPAPPEVTSKEMVDYPSDVSSETDVPISTSAQPSDMFKPDDQRNVVGETKVIDFAETKQPDNEAENSDVPDITLLPPTPKPEDEKRELGVEDDEIDYRRKSSEIRLPGGWSGDDDDTSEIEKTRNALEGTPVSSSREDTSTVDSATAQTATPIHLTQSPLQLSDVSEDSDESDAFSDAVEDQSDIEDEGGFASLDAIVESPIASKPFAFDTKAKDSEPEMPESPSVTQATKKSGRAEAKEASAPQSQSGDWGETTAYWSQLSKERRDQIEAEHRSVDGAKSVPAATTAPTKSKAKNIPSAIKKANAPMSAPVAKQPTTKKQQSTTQATQQPAQPTLRKSMRAQPGPQLKQPPVDDGVHMRRSMRSGGGMAPSMREDRPQRRPQSEYIEPRGTLQKKNLRPMSSGGLPTSSAGATAPAAAAGKGQDSPYPVLTKKKSQQQSDPPQVSARLQKELAQANDSDSESSFKKRRRAGSGSTMDSGGRYTMRRSMRSGSFDQPTSPTANDKRPTSPTAGDRGSRTFSLRSMSPQGGFFGKNKREVPKVSQDSGTRTTLRGPPQRSSRQTPTAAAPRFKSRFADSDDEDDDAPKQSYFKSRFVDSDDEDGPSSPGAMPTNLTPVRGIPKRKGQEDGDSTDLEDEDEDDGQKKSSRKGDKMNVPLVPDPADVEKAMAIARRNLGVSEKPTPEAKDGDEPKEGDILQKGTLRDNPAEISAEPTPTAKAENISFALPEKKRRGFMGSILRRNRNSSSSVQQVSQSSPAQTPASPIATRDSPQAAKPETPSNPSSPAAAKLQRSANKPPLARGNSELSNVSASRTSTGLPQISEKELDSWPRPGSSKTDEKNSGRPSTSDGFSPEAIKLARTMRPDLTPRSASGNQSGQRVRILAGEEGSEPGEREPSAAFSKRTGKKKKFGMLRRAFKLDD